ncbi:hypothetical protein GGI12_002173 [Dipsacomyces acuminosporus]|nr:hypothetical protein GGI12_002173 [Dipsacomyces acuminosporus]
MAKSALVLPKADFLQLQDISARMKDIREPIRELTRSCIVAGPDTGDGGGSSAGAAQPSSTDTNVIFGRIREQLDVVQGLIQQYLGALSDSGASASGAPPASNRPASGGPLALASNTSKRNSHAETMKKDAPHAPPGLPSHSSTRNAAAAGASTSASEPPTTMRSHPHSHSHTQLSTISSTIEKTIHSAWSANKTVFTHPATVNEAYTKLDKRNLATLVERIPHVPVRELVNSSHPTGVVDLVNSLLRSSTRFGSVPMLTMHLESIPPGIAACAIANSTSQIFQQLTAQAVLQHVATTRPAQTSSIPGHGGSAQQLSHPPLTILRMLSDHANFLTRLAERSILYPAHAAQRAKRIEWWATVACLIRELGDYESLSSLVCVFSSPIIGRLKETWDQVPSQCKSAIRFILDRVLKIHPNYSSYRDELQIRISKMKRAAKAAAGGRGSHGTPASTASVDTNGNGDQMSIDFDNAVNIDSPDPRVAETSNINSPVYCKECRDLPPPRVLVPVVAVLLKDAATADASSDILSAASSSSPSAAASQYQDRNKAQGAGASSPSSEPRWMAIIECAANQDMPLGLDNNLLRRIFATDPQCSSPGSASATPGTPRTISAATSFLKRRPRKSSASEKQQKDGASTHCRLISEQAGAPTIIDMLSHLLALASGNPCFACSVGAPLDALHISTSGQLAATVTAILLFTEPWLPQEYIYRLCEMREPRNPQAPFLGKSTAAIAFPQPIAPFQPLAHSSALTMRPQTSDSHGQAPADHGQSGDSPWLMSFKVNDTADSPRYHSRSKSRDMASGSSYKASSGPSGDTMLYPLSPMSPSQSSNGRISQDRNSSHSSHSTSSNTHSTNDRTPIPGSHSINRTPSLHSTASTASKRAVSVISQKSLLPDLPPLPSDARPPPLPSAEMPTSKIPPLPTLPSLPPDSQLAPPPLPSLPMPKGSGIPLPSPPPPPPPLPAMPMPKFQPDGEPQSYKGPGSISRAMSVRTSAASAASLSEKRRSNHESISAETQMLLSFDSP